MALLSGISHWIFYIRSSNSKEATQDNAYEPKVLQLTSQESLLKVSSFLLVLEVKNWMTWEIDFL